MPSTPDPALLTALALPADFPSSNITLCPIGGGCSSASAFCVEVRREDEDGLRVRRWFLKTATATGTATEKVFEGEHHSLNALADACPSLSPRSHGHGTYHSSPQTHYLLTSYLNLSPPPSTPKSKTTLAQKLAKLHTTPAPIPPGHASRKFGFPVPTRCGDTVQDNTVEDSWATFFAKRRLRFIAREIREKRGADRELEGLVERVTGGVVPYLLGERLRSAEGGKIEPVVVHGDLWSGNAGRGIIMDGDVDGQEVEEVIFDPSACYAHSEFELGIMRMFGGFGGRFLDEYHALVGKCRPVEEYADRVRLYEVYHHLNHMALFGAGYRGSAVRILRELVEKYGNKKEESGSL